MNGKLKVSDDSVFKEFAENGASLDGFSDVKVLEILFNDLFGKTKYDCQALAELMLIEHHTLGGVVHASPKSLSKYLDNEDIVKLKEIGAMHRYVMHERCRFPIKLTDKKTLSELLRAVLFEEQEELLYIFPVIKGKLVSECLIDSGGEDSVNLSVRRIRQKLENIPECTGFVMAHNHPDGSTDPSEQDLISTGTVYDLMAKDGYKLFAHYIYTKDAVSEISLEKAHASYFFCK